MTPGLVTLLLYPDMERATTCNLVIDRGVAPDLLIPPLRKRMQFAIDVLMSLRCLATYFSDISTAVGGPSAKAVYRIEKRRISYSAVADYGQRCSQNYR